ncbi:MAG: hypothetical protein ACYCVH_01840 [Ignavibacteriaceae bacterium]
MITNIQVGTKLKLMQPFLGNRIASIAICYNVDVFICGFLFQNDNYFEFTTEPGKNNIEIYFHPDYQTVDKAYINYKYDASNFDNDVTSGLFKSIWGPYYKGWYPQGV